MIRKKLIKYCNTLKRYYIKSVTAIRKYQLKVFESKLYESYESVILWAPSVECSKFNGPASLYRHVIELKKKSTRMQRCIAPAGKKKR